ncbi:MAG: DUF2934 domain-containing protein [Bacteroidetes bacterium]|nr:MAG: DUF2934 domain-containing protein [Bacteroidota bacterium]
MLDICLCTGTKCPFKMDCYRFTAQYYGRQNFFGSPPFKNNTCEHFMDNSQQISYLAYQLWIADGRQEGKDDLYWFTAKGQLIR